MAKVWVLDTETKGTGAHIAPLEHAPDKRSRDAELRVVRGRRASAAPKEPEPRRPRAFKIVDVTTGAVRGEDLDTRAALDVLDEVPSVVDVRIYIRDPETDDWVLLTLGEQKALWSYRRRG
jgi:hypothetical protein